MYRCTDPPSIVLAPYAKSSSHLYGSGHAEEREAGVTSLGPCASPLSALATWPVREVAGVGRFHPPRERLGNPLIFCSPACHAVHRSFLPNGRAMAVPQLQFKDCELDTITLSWSVWPRRLRALAVFLLEIAIARTTSTAAVYCCVLLLLQTQPSPYFCDDLARLHVPTFRTPRVPAASTSSTYQHWGFVLDHRHTHFFKHPSSLIDCCNSTRWPWHFQGAGRRHWL